MSNGQRLGDPRATFKTIRGYVGNHLKNVRVKFAYTVRGRGNMKITRRIISADIIIVHGDREVAGRALEGKSSWPKAHIIKI